MKQNNLKASKEKKTHYVQRNKDKNDSRFLFGINASQKTVEKHLQSIFFFFLRILHFTLFVHSHHIPSHKNWNDFIQFIFPTVCPQRGVIVFCVVLSGHLLPLQDHPIRAKFSSIEMGSSFCLHSPRNFPDQRQLNI